MGNLERNTHLYIIVLNRNLVYKREVFYKHLTESPASVLRQYDLILQAKIVHSYKDFLFLKSSFFFLHFMI